LVDVSALVFALALPIVFLQMNWAEHFITIYLYITSGLVSHSSVLYDHHVKHHRFLNCNYCLFLPIMDVLFNTYR
jgi:sterol desaturase/sphingolipid hydroxylase (fatty acid hydroxylase superfamily)